MGQNLKPAQINDFADFITKKHVRIPQIAEKVTEQFTSFPSSETALVS
jgi:hypothetical protein